MSKLNRRIQKIALSLTPKQAVLDRLAENHRQFNRMEELVCWLSKPENLALLHNRWRQVEEETREALKGQTKETIQRACRQARQEMAFLLALHQTINFTILEEDSSQQLMLAHLASRLQFYTREHLVSMNMSRLIGRTARMPYPLDQEMAGVACGIIRHAVHSLSITDHQLEEWLSSEEDTPMAYGQFKKAAQELIKDKKLVAGKTVSLSAIPVMGFRTVPVVEGEWVDQVLVELAEWGALLEEKGYQVKRPDDEHPLAMDLYYPEDAVWDQETLPEAIPWLALFREREKVRANWQHFHGEIRHFDDRPYIRLEDYIQWKKRLYRGEFDVEEGVLIRSWNDWLASSHGNVELAGIPVDKLDYWFHLAYFVVCETALDALVRQEERQGWIESMRQFIVNRYEASAEYDPVRYISGIGERCLPVDNKTFKEKIMDWKQSACGFLLKQYVNQEAIRLIQGQYFDGQSMLFRVEQQRLNQRLERTERLAEVFNLSLAEFLDDGVQERENQSAIQPETLKMQARQAAFTMAKGMVVRAKAQALEQLGRDTEAQEIYRQMLT